MSDSKRLDDNKALPKPQSADELFQLASQYEHGLEGKPCDLILAHDFYKKAADAKHPKAAAAIQRLLIESPKTPGMHPNDQLKAFLEHEAKKNNGMAFYGLGEYYWNNRQQLSDAKEIRDLQEKLKYSKVIINFLQALFTLYEEHNPFYRTVARRLALASHNWGEYEYDFIYSRLSGEAFSYYSIKRPGDFFRTTCAQSLYHQLMVQFSQLISISPQMVLDEYDRPMNLVQCADKFYEKFERHPDIYLKSFQRDFSAMFVELKDQAHEMIKYNLDKFLHIIIAGCKVVHRNSAGDIVRSEDRNLTNQLAIFFANWCLQNEKSEHAIRALSQINNTAGLRNEEKIIFGEQILNSFSLKEMKLSDNIFEFMHGGNYTDYHHLRKVGLENLSVVMNSVWHKDEKQREVKDAKKKEAPKSVSAATEETPPLSAEEKRKEIENRIIEEAKAKQLKENEESEQRQFLVFLFPEAKARDAVVDSKGSLDESTPDAKTVFDKKISQLEKKSEELRLIGWHILPNQIKLEEKANDQMKTEWETRCQQFRYDFEMEEKLEAKINMIDIFLKSVPPDAHSLPPFLNKIKKNLQYASLYREAKVLTDTHEEAKACAILAIVTKEAEMSDADILFGTLILNGRGTAHDEKKSFDLLKRGQGEARTLKQMAEYFEQKGDEEKSRSYYLNLSQNNEDQELAQLGKFKWATKFILLQNRFEAIYDPNDTLDREEEFAHSSRDVVQFRDAIKIVNEEAKAENKEAIRALGKLYETRGKHLVDMNKAIEYYYKIPDHKAIARCIIKATPMIDLAVRTQTIIKSQEAESGRIEFNLLFRTVKPIIDFLTGLSIINSDDADLNKVIGDFYSARPDIRNILGPHAYQYEINPAAHFYRKANDFKSMEKELDKLERVMIHAKGIDQNNLAKELGFFYHSLNDEKYHPKMYRAFSYVRHGDSSQNQMLMEEYIITLKQFEDKDQKNRAQQEKATFRIQQLIRSGLISDCYEVYVRAKDHHDGIEGRARDIKDEVPAGMIAILLDRHLKLVREFHWQDLMIAIKKYIPESPLEEKVLDLTAYFRIHFEQALGNQDAKEQHRLSANLFRDLEEIAKEMRGDQSTLSLFFKPPANLAWVLAIQKVAQQILQKVIKQEEAEARASPNRPPP